MTKKNMIFFGKAHFPIFLKSSAAHAKIFVCVLFHANLFDQTQCNSISPFSNDKLFKTGVHFRVLLETLKATQMTYVKDYILNL